MGSAEDFPGKEKDKFLLSDDLKSGGFFVTTP